MTKASKHLQELQRSLLEALGQLLTANAFEADPKNQSFVRCLPGGTGKVHVAFINHAEDFDLTLDFGVRIDAVEEIVNSLEEGLSKAEKKRTSTLGIEYGNLLDGKPRRWTVKSDKDVPTVVQEISRAVIGEGVSYFAKYSSVPAALALLSGDGPDAWRHSPIHDSRARRALALAKVANTSRSQFDQLAAAKQDFLEQRKDFGLARFRAFRASLSEPWDS